MVLSLQAWGQESLRKSELFKCFHPKKEKGLLDLVMSQHLNDQWVFKINNLKFQRNELYSLIYGENFSMRGVLLKERTEIIKTFDPDFPYEGPVKVETKVYKTSDKNFINIEMGNSEKSMDLNILKQKEIIANRNGVHFSIKKLAQIFDKDHISSVDLRLFENDKQISDEYGLSYIDINPDNICAQLRVYVKKQPSKFSDTLYIEEVILNPISELELDYEIFILPKGHRLLPKP